jgi:hypothetical protein
MRLDQPKHYFITCREGYALKSNYLNVTHLLEANLYLNVSVLKLSFFLFFSSEQTFTQRCSNQDIDQGFILKYRVALGIFYRNIVFK